jgi:ComF family protein
MFADIRDLLFTPTCIGCSALGLHVCSTCLDGICPQTSTNIPGLEQVISASPYGGWLRDAIIEYKNGGRRQVHGLAQVLHRVTLGYSFDVPVMVVPMPSSVAKVATRGFDTISLLTRECMKLQPHRFGFVGEALVARREVADQVGLSAVARQENVTNSMLARQAISGTILLVDDVITTGSTMREAARVLHLAGAKKVFGISLCGSSKWG